MTISRREFTYSAAALGLSGIAAAESESKSSAPVIGPATTVKLFGDGLDLAPNAYAELLHTLSQQEEVIKDTYLLGGAVEELEQHCARLLGKEMAVFMPSGTLANQLALRALTGPRRRVIVPGLSHVYNDTGDACQTLANLNLIPLAPDRATFTAEDVETVLTRTAGGRVTTEVGAILIESPIRRLSGEMFDWNEIGRITALARDRGIGTHLDGARLFIASAYTGITPAEFAAPFDTVFVSLWKYFNSGIGAILAGPRSQLENMFHTRRMFGGNLFEGWPAALVARHFMHDFVDRLTSAVHISEEFYKAIENLSGVNVVRIPNGTNVARISLSGIDIPKFRQRLAAKNILIRKPNTDGTITLSVNETWNLTSAQQLAGAFEQAMT